MLQTVNFLKILFSPGGCASARVPNGVRWFLTLVMALRNILFSLLVQWSCATSLQKHSPEEVQQLLSEWHLGDAFGKQVRLSVLFY